MRYSTEREVTLPVFSYGWLKAVDLSNNRHKLTLEADGLIALLAAVQVLENALADIRVEVDKLHGLSYEKIEISK